VLAFCTFLKGCLCLLHTRSSRASSPCQQPAPARMRTNCSNCCQVTASWWSGHAYPAPFLCCRRGQSGHVVRRVRAAAPARR
jgi:hypothetical protein